MKKNAFLLLGAALLVLALSGCGGNQPPDSATTETVKLYYGDANNERMVTEEREITYSDESEKYQAALEQLIQGPEDASLRANINKDTVVHGTLQQGNDIIVDLSKEFFPLGGIMAEEIAVGSIVNTLTQFDGIDRVKILVEGEELIGPSGQPRGFMEPFPETWDTGTPTDVTLYFGNADATFVKAETRTINVPAGVSREQFIRMVVEELIQGPEDPNLYKTIPPEATVNSVTLDGDTAHVDFSEEMQTKHWGGAAGESMTINSIVNTLTEFDYVKSVLMTVDGQPMAIEHCILDQPVERNENMIEK